MRAHVRFVDGDEVVGDPGGWREFRSDGVDAVTVEAQTGSTSIAGMTLYWMRLVGDDWHLGGAALGEGYGAGVALPPEVVIHPDGTMTEHALEWVPDLDHADVKMGWWWPGTEGQPRG